MTPHWDPTSGLFHAPALPPELRPYQTEAIAKIEDAIARGVRRIMLMLPTGGGKTLVASTMTATRKRVLFVVPRLELINQTWEKFHQAGIHDVGVIQGYNRLTDSSQPIQICSQQTLARREIPPADPVFIDEAHTLFNFYSDWMTRPEWSAVPFIGLSATPWTKGLQALSRTHHCSDQSGSDSPGLSCELPGVCPLAS